MSSPRSTNPTGQPLPAGVHGARAAPARAAAPAGVAGSRADEWFVVFVRRAALAGLVASLALHVLFMAAAYVLRIAGPAGSASGNPLGRTSVEVAMMSQEELAAVAEAELDIAGPQAAEVQALALPELMLGSVEGGSGAPDAAELGQVGAGIGGAGTGAGVGAGEGAGGSGGGGATFFGVAARGNRFCYIVDISGSMADRDKLRELKRQLINSLDKLPQGAQFLIYFFSSESRVLGGRERWIEANGRNKESAENEIRALLANGGTNPGPAFISALSIKPRPDAIYFMTDGMFDVEIVPRIARMNRTGRTIPIHCIGFGERGSEALMRSIAQDSSGTYTFVEAPPR